jgi:hypothetical protein
MRVSDSSMGGDAGRFAKIEVESRALIAGKGGLSP